MVLGIDDSEHSFYALEWTLDRYFADSRPNHPYKLVVFHARPTPSSVVGIGGPGFGDFMTVMELDFKKRATRTVEKAKEVCKSKLVDDVNVEIVEGDPRNVICEAVDRHLHFGCGKSWLWSGKEGGSRKRRRQLCSSC